MLAKQKMRWAEHTIATPKVVTRNTITTNLKSFIFSTSSDEKSLGTSIIMLIRKTDKTYLVQSIAYSSAMNYD
jgi:hypothetical protein